MLDFMDTTDEWMDYSVYFVAVILLMFVRTRITVCVY